MEQEQQLYNFTKAWLLILASLTSSFFIGKIIPKGTKRLFCFLPIFALFFAIPLNLTSIHLGGFTSFFISWLANFKLLLFAFGDGPLSTPSISLIHFLLISCLPIKIQQKSLQKLDPSGPNGRDQTNSGHKSLQNYAIKGLFIAIFIRVYVYREFIHPNVILFMYFFHIYFAMELALAIVASLARAILGFELEPQFNDPYLSTSLQDFWGRRWNLMVTSILHPTIYNPLLKTFASIIGRKWAPLPAIMGSFIVSGIMHEIIFYYFDLEREKPTWEMTCFFLLHGVSMVIEVALKKIVNRKWQLPRFISTPLTIGYVMATGFWLFMPAILRCRVDIRAFEEYSALTIFLKNVGLYFRKNF